MSSEGRRPRYRLTRIRMADEILSEELAETVALAALVLFATLAPRVVAMIWAAL